MVFDRERFRKIARLDAPEKLSLGTYFHHTEHAVTIFDAYSKAIFHLLVLPRIKNKGPYNAKNLTSLKTLLNSPSVTKGEALEVLRQLKEEADHVKAECIKEMKDRWGFTWDLLIGFHAVQSMDHMHLHIISDEMHSPTLKTKKHYNSFHPKLGFFLHLDEVLSWFEEDKGEAYFKSMIKLDGSMYGKILKEPLRCLHCNKEHKNMPALKDDLAAHYNKLLEDDGESEKSRKGQAEKPEVEKIADKKESRKRKTPEDDEDSANNEAQRKKTAT